MADSLSRERCPFYGFHWPEKTRALHDTGADECALDFQHNGPCAMEQEGKQPDYEVCPRVRPIRVLLESAAHHVTIYPGEIPAGVSMAEWTRRVTARRRTAT